MKAIRRKRVRPIYKNGGKNKIVTKKTPDEQEKMIEQSGLSEAEYFKRFNAAIDKYGDDVGLAFDPTTGNFAPGNNMLPTAEVETGFVPQDIPEGYDPYENNSMEQKIFDNLGMEGVLEYRKMREGTHESTEPFGKVAMEVLSLIEGGPVATRGIPALRRMFMRKAGKFVDDIPANQLYRGIGKEGADDALKSGVLRPKVRPNAAKPKGSGFLMEKQYKNVYASPNPMIAKRYGGGYLASIPKDASKFVRRYKGKDWSMKSADVIPTDKVNILRESLYRDFLGRPKVGYRVLNK